MVDEADNPGVRARAERLRAIQAKAHKRLGGPLTPGDVDDIARQVRIADQARHLDEPDVETVTHRISQVVDVAGQDESSADAVGVGHRILRDGASEDWLDHRDEPDAVRARDGANLRAIGPALTEFERDEANLRAAIAAAQAGDDEPVAER
jgi:hypothetical protein